MSRQTKTLHSLLFLAGLLIRIALIPNPGFEADISFWKSWGLGVLDKGFVEGIRATNNNYPLPFSYTLGAMAWVYHLCRSAQLQCILVEYESVVSHHQ